jgi:hypothetical protein
MERKPAQNLAVYAKIAEFDVVNGRFSRYVLLVD